MHHHTNNPLHILHYDVKEIRHLFTSTAIRLFGAGIIGGFSSLLIFRMFDNPIDGLINVLYFFIINSLTTVLFNILVSSRTIHKRGTKISMIIGVFFLVVYQFALYGLGKYTGSISIAAILLGIFTAFFRTAFHFNISSNKKSKKLGEKVAFLNIIITVVLALGPLLGGFLIESYGVGISVTVSSVLVFSSIVPLLLSYKKHKDCVPRTEDTSISVAKFLKNNIKNPSIVTFFSKGYIAFIGGTIRPILIFMQFGNFTKVGGILAGTTIISVFLLYFTGKLLNKNKETSLMKRTIGFQVLTRFSGIFAVVSGLLSGVVLSVIDVISKFTEKVNKTCIEKSFYDEVGDPKINLYEVILHETSIHGSKIIIFGIFIILLKYFNLSLNGAFSVLLILLIIVLPLQYSIFFKRKNKIKTVNKNITKN